MLFFYDKPGFDEGLGAFIFSSPAMLGMIVLVYFLIGAGLAIWSYKNAKKRNMKYKAWLLAILLTGFIGFLVYLTIRDPLTSEKN
jgi:glucose uptake protein GlcU